MSRQAGSREPPDVAETEPPHPNPDRSAIEPRARRGRRASPAVHRPAEAPFLEGPRSRTAELFRLFRIGLEFMRGFRTLHFVGPCATVFGSSRFPPDHRYYELARETGRRLGQAGITVMTGGGPGVMAAANRGAQEGGGRSVGCAIDLPQQESRNPFLDVGLEFHYFFIRKVMLVKYSYGFIVFPGGMGTLDEVFETLTLIQTDKIRDFPLILMGLDYWQPLIGFLRQTMIPEGTVEVFEVDRIHMTDSPAEAAELVERTMERAGRGPKPPVRPRRMLREQGFEVEPRSRGKGRRPDPTSEAR